MLRGRWLRTTLPTLSPSPAGGDGGALGIVSAGVMRFINCAFYDNYCQYGSGGASEGRGSVWKGGRVVGQETAASGRNQQGPLTSGARLLDRT